MPKTPSRPTQRNMPTKTPSTPSQSKEYANQVCHPISKFQNVDLRWFVPKQILSQIYALFLHTFLGLKICFRAKNDKYNVCESLTSLPERLVKLKSSLKLPKKYQNITKGYYVEYAIQMNDKLD